MQYLIWEIISLVIGSVLVYLGARMLRQSDRDFLADREAWVRKHSQSAAEREKKMRQFVEPVKSDTTFWRLNFAFRGMAAGVVSLAIFILLVLYDFVA